MPLNITSAALTMATNNDTGQKNTVHGQVYGAVGAPTPSERDLRALRRRMGMPVPISPDPDCPPTEGRRLPKRKVDSDDEFDEVCRTPK